MKRDNPDTSEFDLRYDCDKYLYITKDTKEPFTGLMFVSFNKDNTRPYRLETNMKDGKFHGFARSFFKDGRLRTESYYVEGKRVIKET